MKQIGLISDTHSYLDDAVFRHFEKCDEIWHVGDFGTIELANQLKDFGPLRGVYGNIDGADVRKEYAEVLNFTCENVKVLMVHIGGYPNKYSALAKQKIAETKPQLFLSGHSHILKVMYDSKFNCLHMNPGAAGRQGWHQVRTLIRFAIDGADIKNCEIIELGKRG